MRSKILLIEDSESFANSIRLVLRSHSVDVVWSESGAAGIKAFRENQHGFATVIVDYCLPDLKGSEVAQALKKINPKQELLFASGYRNPEFLIDFLEVGGMRGFIAKDRPTEEIRSKILDSIAAYQTQGRIIGKDDYTPTQRELDLRSTGMVGRSTVMHEVYQKVQKYRGSPYPVLIVGETGTGKELVAQALVPAGKKMVTVNCPRFIDGENLLESELFGYVKGAFTGASADTRGLLSQAHDQVVFLDELHQLSLAAQAKLLRFLQEMRFRRVGDNSGPETSIKFRLISAAKPDIYEMVKEGSFLEDLLYRVGQIQIQIPPLREREGDLEVLVRMIQDEFNNGKPLNQHKLLRASTIHEMAKFLWPGNVRQLQSAVRQMLTDSDSDIVDPVGFEMFLKNTKMKSEMELQPNQFSLGESLEHHEREQIFAALKSSHTQSEAARKLGIPISSFSRKLSSLGIIAKHYLLTNYKETKL